MFMEYNLVKRKPKLKMELFSGVQEWPEKRISPLKNVFLRKVHGYFKVQIRWMAFTFC